MGTHAIVTRWPRAGTVPVLSQVSGMSCVPGRAMTARMNVLPWSVRIRRTLVTVPVTSMSVPPEPVSLVAELDERPAVAEPPSRQGAGAARDRVAVQVDLYGKRG